MSQQLVLEMHSSSREGKHDLKTFLDSILEDVFNSVSPVWPLKDYVAVNPYFGLVDRGFMSARSFLRVFSDGDLLMPMSYFSELWQQGKIDVNDIRHALDEVLLPASVGQLSVEEIIQALSSANNSARGVPGSNSQHVYQKRASNPKGRQKLEGAGMAFAEWHEIVTDEISKFCAAHFDDGQATWGSGWKDMSLYTAWRETAKIDRNAECLGLTGMRRLVASLPEDPALVIVDLLRRLELPSYHWHSFLLNQIFSIPGWFAWAKYQDQLLPAGSELEHSIGLLAIRVVYTYAVVKELDGKADWSAPRFDGYTSFPLESGEQSKSAWIRYVLLRATEIRYRQQLLSRLPTHPSARTVPSKTQMVFCIDVRSERMRRQIENHDNSIETFGFAGFFGVPMEFLPLGEVQPTPQLPVLLSPQYRVHECVRSESPCSHSQVLNRRMDLRWYRKLWQSFKSSSIGSFAFVESSGILAIIQLVAKSFGMKIGADHESDGLKSTASMLQPNVGVDAASGVALADQIEIAARMLTNLGLTQHFARLVIFCGHFSKSSNNPLAAGLDCGACGGHSGAPNARWLAMVLNQADVRSGLLQRGIEIPTDSRFFAAAHETTTDSIEFYLDSEIPSSHLDEFEQLRKTCLKASAAVVRERLSAQKAISKSEIARRAVDWSEVRPEWGLAGNTAFFVGPRSTTKGLDLEGRVFLHSYDEERDPTGAVLETIMTAPMVVANWINMQYYASTVDNRHFGSGSKTIHNVVGRFGILSGSGGDLKTGLPMQSLHDGTEYQHQPMRLLVVICASRASIDRIYRKHALVANLIHNEWISLIAAEGGKHYRLSSNSEWILVS